VTGQHIRWFVPAALESVDRERTRVLDRLKEWGVQVDTKTSDTLALLVADRVRDAIRYSRTAQISLTLRVTGRELLFEAVSHDPPEPCPGEQQGQRDRTLLTLLATDWGESQPAGSGTGVWFLLALPDPLTARRRRNLIARVREARPRQVVHRFSGRSDSAA
jgi:hypothetical protein